MAFSRSALIALAALLIWGIAYLGWTAEWIAWTAPHAIEHLTRRAILCLLGAGLCWLISLALDSLKTRGWRVRVAAGLALSLVSLCAYVILNFLLFYEYRPLWGHYTYREGILTAEGAGWVFLLWSAVYFAILTYEDAYNSRLKLSEASRAELKARYHALTVQTQPHFLFNSLNSISALIIEKEPARAEQVLLALSSLLRTTLEAETRQSTSLGNELVCVRRYLQIETIRYQDRLVYVESVRGDCLDAQIPPLILLPLIENVIRHGVSHSTKPVTLTLTAFSEDGFLYIEILDDANPEADAIPTPGAGIGQENVRQRLAILFGSEASLVCTSCQDGYSAALTLPAGRQKNA